MADPGEPAHWRRESLRRTGVAVLLLVLLAAGPVVGLGLYAFRAGAGAIEQLVEEENDAAATLTATLVETELQRRIHDAEGFAAQPGLASLLQARDEAAVRTRLRAFVESRPRVVRGFVTDPQGMLWSDFPKAPESLGKRFDYRDWYEGVSREWSPYVAEVYQRHAEPKPLVVATAVPVRTAKGRVVGIFVHQLRLEGLTKLTRDVNVGSAGLVFVVDHTGTVAAHPELELQRGTHDRYASAEPVRAASDGELEPHGALRYVDPVSDRRMIASAVPVSAGEHSWTVIAQQPVGEAYAPIDALGRNILAAGGFVLLGAAILVVMLARAYRRADRTNAELAERNARLAEVKGQLEEVNRELESFSYSVSHDLRAPLRSLDGFSQALLEDYGDALGERGRDYAGRIRAAAQRMSKQIDDLLQLSRIGRAELRRRTVDVSALARESIEELRAGEPERDVDVHIEEGIEVDGDPDLLRAVVDNLLGNAWKFTRDADEARIELASLEWQQEQGFVVRDNGAGFDSRYVDKLFGAFQRLHHTSEFSGTGVGLATVQRIVHRHGGKVWAEGAVGEGASFYVTLPAHGSEENRE